MEVRVIKKKKDISTFSYSTHFLLDSLYLSLSLTYQKKKKKSQWTIPASGEVFFFFPHSQNNRIPGKELKITPDRLTMEILVYLHSACPLGFLLLLLFFQNIS